MLIAKKFIPFSKFTYWIEIKSLLKLLCEYMLPEICWSQVWWARKILSWGRKFVNQKPFFSISIHVHFGAPCYERITKEMVLFINLLGKVLTQEIRGDGDCIWWAPGRVIHVHGKLAPHYLYIIKQMKKPKPWITQPDKTLRTFENTREMKKTFACGWYFLHFPRVLKCPSRFITCTV